MHSITSDRLLIRPLNKQDKSLFISFYTDTKIMRNIGKVLSIDKAEKAFNNTLRIMGKAQPQIMIWAIINLTNNKTIGIQSFTWSTNKNKYSAEKKRAIAEIGIILATNSQGIGFAQEAMTALIQYGFNNMSLDKINVLYETKNLASKRLFNNLKFNSDVTLQNNIKGSTYHYLDKLHWQKN